LGHSPRFGHRLRAVEHLELAEDIRDVIADRLWTQRQHLGDLRITLAVHDQRQHLALALRQLRESVCRNERAHVGEILHETLRDWWTEDRLARRDDVDR